METYEHITLYLFSVLPFYALNLIFHWILVPYYFALLGLVFPLTYLPDVDHALNALEKSTNLIVKKIVAFMTKTLGFDHRSFWTHSAIFPVLYFLIMRTFLLGTALYLVLLLFYYPIIIHLLGDYKVFSSMIDVVVNSKKINQKFGGTWQICFLFGKRLGKNGSRIWLIGNMITMIIILILV